MANSIKLKSILYVEDEKGVQEELSEVIQDFCETLYLADDGVQGLQQYKKIKPDIVITDIKMPFMDGIEMSKKIKEINEDAHIIFTTAFSDIEFFQEAIDLQVDGYILKPTNLMLLEKKILNIAKQINIKYDLQRKEQMLIQQSKLASMGEMIGNIAHQWKQPLSIISVSATAIGTNLELGMDVDKNDLEECVKNVSNQVKYLSNTIDDFKNFFKPSEDKNTTFNVKKFIDKCVELVKASFVANTINTIKDIDEKINTYGDPNQLTQALINILNNAKDALKYAEDIQEKLVFILTVKEDENNENIIITIKDNAGGIPEKIIDRIYEPYFTTKSENEGTGLGLYITHTIITKNLKGTIFVENEEFMYEGKKYKGAKFTISLPLSNN